MTPAERRNYVEGAMELLHRQTRDGVLMAAVATKWSYLYSLNLDDVVLLQKLVGENMKHHDREPLLQEILGESYDRVEEFLKEAKRKLPLKKKLEQNPKVRFRYREEYEEDKS